MAVVPQQRNFCKNTGPECNDRCAATRIVQEFCRQYESMPCVREVLQETISDSAPIIGIILRPSKNQDEESGRLNQLSSHQPSVIDAGFEWTAVGSHLENTELRGLLSEKEEAIRRKDQKLKKLKELETENENFKILINRLRNEKIEERKRYEQIIHGLNKLVDELNLLVADLNKALLMKELEPYQPREIKIDECLERDVWLNPITCAPPEELVSAYKIQESSSPCYEPPTKRWKPEEENDAKAISCRAEEPAEPSGSTEKPKKRNPRAQKNIDWKIYNPILIAALIVIKLRDDPEKFELSEAEINRRIKELTGDMFTVDQIRNQVNNICKNKKFNSKKPFLEFKYDLMEWQKLFEKLDPSSPTLIDFEDSEHSELIDGGEEP